MQLWRMFERSSFFFGGLFVFLLGLGVAEANPRSQMREVRILARSLENDASAAYQLATQYANNPQERMRLTTLSQFAFQAAAFQNATDHLTANLANTEAAFQMLTFRYRRASADFVFFTAYRLHRYTFESLRPTMEQLTAIYSSAVPYPPYPTRPPYGSLEEKASVFANLAQSARASAEAESARYRDPAQSTAILALFRLEHAANGLHYASSNPAYARNAYFTARSAFSEASTSVSRAAFSYRIRDIMMRMERQLAEIGLYFDFHRR